MSKSKYSKYKQLQIPFYKQAKDKPQANDRKPNDKFRNIQLYTCCWPSGKAVEWSTQ